MDYKPIGEVNAGIENCLRMAAKLLDEVWGTTDKPKHWVQIEINPNLNIIRLEIGTKHLDGTEERPIATYRFNNDGSYHKQVHS